MIPKNKKSIDDDFRNDIQVKYKNIKIIYLWDKEG